MSKGRVASVLRASPSLGVVIVVLFAAVVSPSPWGSAGGAGAALAQSSDELREQLDDARDVQQGIQTELEGAVEERRAVEQDLLAATAAVDVVLADIDAVQDRRAGIQAEVARLQGDAAATRESLAAQIRALYIAGAAEDFTIALDADAVAQVGVRSHYLEALARTDRARLEELEGLTTTLAAREADLDRVDAELAELREQAELAQAELDRQLFLAAGIEAEVADRLAAAESQARRLAAEAEAAASAAERAEAAERAAAIAAAQEAARRAEEARVAAEAAAVASRPQAPAGGGTPSAPVSSGGKSCPQDHPRSFTDTWGAPRSGGRTHKGTDIFGARGGNVFAITDGVVTRTTTGRLAGLMLVLRGDDGNDYWYLHLQDFVASAGQRVSSGQLIAHNGDTGNARGTTPHIHFELHPGGGGPVNPYSLLRQVCG